MMKKLFVLLTVFVFFAAGQVLADTPKAGGTLVFGRGGDSVGLDPAYETDGNSFMICDNIFEALVAYADESTSLEPGLAKSWDISPDGKFRLRNVHRSIGSPWRLTKPSSLLRLSANIQSYST